MQNPLRSAAVVVAIAVATVAVPVYLHPAEAQPSGYCAPGASCKVYSLTTTKKTGPSISLQGDAGVCFGDGTCTNSGASSNPTATTFTSTAGAGVSSFVSPSDAKVCYNGATCTAYTRFETGNGLQFFGPTGTNIQFRTDAQVQAYLSIQAGQQSANQLTIAGSSTGNKVTVTASGSDTDVGISLVTKGAGVVLAPTLNLTNALGVAYGGTGQTSTLAKASALIHTALTYANQTWTTVNADTVQFDTASAVTTGASWHYTAPVTGYYLMCYTVSLAQGNNTLNDFIIRFYKNGTTELFPKFRPGTRAGAVSALTGATGCGVYSLTAADTVALQVYQDSGGGRVEASLDSSGLTINQVL